MKAASQRTVTISHFVAARCVSTYLPTVTLAHHTGQPTIATFHNTTTPVCHV